MEAIVPIVCGVSFAVLALIGSVELFKELGFAVRSKAR
ncbi:hypothetical protein EV05_1166 [Prochlorococcus sp. MIT 0601]|nr:hypothetical protein EV05_1166 [Prochlorococcus sp. MIT 0601]